MTCPCVVENCAPPAEVVAPPASSVRDEPAIAFDEGGRVAADLMPRERGGAYSRDAVKSWVRVGLIAANGNRVRLEAYKAGPKKWLTSREAVQRFVASLRGS